MSRNFIMYRSFADTMGLNWPKEIAMIVGGERITYAQLLAERKAKQAKHLAELMRADPPRKAAYLWTFYQPGLFGFAYMGWWTYIRTLADSWCLSPRSFQKSLLLDVMRQFPMRSGADR